MGLQADVSPYGSQTVTGSGWPNVDEDALASAAAQYEAFAAKLTGSVVPLQTSQLAALSAEWTGGGSLAAAGEATSIIGEHQANAAHAAAIALKLRSMEVTVAKTKALVNATALEVQQECTAIAAMPVSNTSELIQSRIKLGLSQNTADVTSNTTELAAGLGIPPTSPDPGNPATQAAGEGAQQGSQQAMQMISQLGSMLGQLPGMLSQAPQALTQPLQQLSQPLQQLTSMFSSGGSSSSAAGASAAGASAAKATPFSSFSNHPLAGGSGAGGGAGMVKAASTPGAGGASARTPLLASLVSGSPTGAALSEVAVASAATVGAGVAPVGAGGGMGGMGMMGQRGESGGTGASLGAPEQLDHDLGEDVDDDW